MGWRLGPHMPQLPPRGRPTLAPMEWPLLHSLPQVSHLNLQALAVLVLKTWLTCMESRTHGFVAM